MNAKVNISKVIMAFVSILLLLLSFNSLDRVQAIGQAQPLTPVVIPTPVPGGPGFVSVNGGTFTPMQNNMSWAVYAGELYNFSDSVDGSYIAPITLPHGAKVLRLVVFYSDSEDIDLSVGLYRKPLDSFIQSVAITASQGTGGFGSAVTETIYGAVVDNQQYSYFASVHIPPMTHPRPFNLSLVGIRVDYSYPEYLPLVSK